MLNSQTTTASTINVRDLKFQLHSHSTRVVIDVRDDYEIQFGIIPGSLHCPIAELIDQIHQLVPDKNELVVVYCELGSRSNQAVHLLASLGYKRVQTLEGGFSCWRSERLETVLPGCRSISLPTSNSGRYERQISLREVGYQGQLKISNARVLVIGLGGLGSPAALYLAGAGVGTLGLMDSDSVDTSNLNRQIIHDARHVGSTKTESAKSKIFEYNPEVRFELFSERFDSNSAKRILSQNWDVVIDGSDNFETRCTLNAFARNLGIPVCHGAIDRFEGSITTFLGTEGPCYQCLFPNIPPLGTCGSCSERGVLGVLPGLIGTLQATEAMKIILGVGQLAVGRLITYDALSLEFHQILFTKNPYCPICSRSTEVL